jgi:branched-chain amino acid aminotransferase
MMNVMFVIGDIIVTPPSSETVLDGVTKDSLLTLAADLEFKVEERPVSLDELENGFRTNSISEAFGVGTAAVVAPIRTININDVDFHLPEYSHEKLSHKLKQKLERIRTGQEEDLYNWCHVV